MITEDKRFIDIQGILAMSDVRPADCIKINDLIIKLSKENQLLNKQFEEKENIACNWKDSCLENAGKIEKLENQQKEFISYLENEIKERNIQMAGYHPTTQLLIEQIIETEKMVLSKYKEIIGGKDER